MTNPSILYRSVLLFKLITDLGESGTDPNGRFQIGIVLPVSVARYFRQEALASDVHAMSGATIGNLLNAHELNTRVENIQHLIFIAGNNELNENYSTEEFMKVMDPEQAPNIIIQLLHQGSHFRSSKQKFIIHFIHHGERLQK